MYNQAFLQETRYMHISMCIFIVLYTSIRCTAVDQKTIPKKNSLGFTNNFIFFVKVNVFKFYLYKVCAILKIKISLIVDDGLSSF